MAMRSIVISVMPVAYCYNASQSSAYSLSHKASSDFCMSVTHGHNINMISALFVAHKHGVNSNFCSVSYRPCYTLDIHV